MAVTSGVTRRRALGAVPTGPETAAQVERIKIHPQFVGLSRGIEVLEYCIREKLAGRGAQLNELGIAMDVLKKEDYDPDQQSNVRTIAGRLRKALNRYYETVGLGDLVLIRLPKGSYLPEVEYNPLLGLGEPSDAEAMLFANAMAAFEKRTLSGYQEAMSYVELGLKGNPGHLRMLALKAMVHVASAMYGKDSLRELKAGEAILHRIRGKHIPLWEARYTEAEIQISIYKDWRQAGELFQSATNLDGNVRYRPWYLAYLASQMRGEEAIKLLKEAISHSAYNVPLLRADLAWHQILAGHLDEAEETLRIASQLFPRGHYLYNVYSAMFYEASGEPARAAEAIRRVSVDGSNSRIVSGLLYLFPGLAGERALAQDCYHELLSIRNLEGGFVPASQIAGAALGAGDHDAAIEWYAKAAEEGDPVMLWVALFPFNRHLYGHASFRRVVTDIMRLKLAPWFLS